MCVYSGLGKTCDVFPDTMFGGCKGLNKTKHAEMELQQEIFEFSGESFVPMGEVTLPFKKQITVPGNSAGFMSPDPSPGELLNGFTWPTNYGSF